MAGVVRWYVYRSCTTLKTYDVKNYIVEPEGSVLNGGVSHPHATEGIGSEKWPSFLEKN